MPKHKSDRLKRTTAQSVNHMAQAILDLNDLYVQFKEQHPDIAEGLKAIMIQQNAVRDATVKFAGHCWNMTEEQLQSYI